MIDHDTATVKELFSTSSQIRMEKLFSLLLKKKIDQPRQVAPTQLPQNIEFPPFCFPPKISKKFSPTDVLFEILVPLFVPPLKFQKNFPHL